MLRAVPRDLPPATLPRHQRAVGGFELRLGPGPGGAVLRALEQRAPLRVLFPRPEPGEPLLAAVLNCAGGIAGGDRLTQSVRLEAGARATLCTAAAEKAYRSLGPAAELATRLELGPGATLEWLPQETILFDGARLTRRIEFRLAEGARLLAAEMLVFGRAARGERLCTGALLDAWRLYGPAGLAWADGLALQGELGARLADPFGFAEAGALGTVLLWAP
ncbi:MAG TPA: urease accessory protein UreD, partial [Crenalkalicoccus sp.]|nr:urease accessory protein UreD [Crenalkalicoccus sp.]